MEKFSIVFPLLQSHPPLPQLLLEDQETPSGFWIRGPLSTVGGASGRPPRISQTSAWPIPTCARQRSANTRQEHEKEIRYRVPQVCFWLPRVRRGAFKRAFLTGEAASRADVNAMVSSKQSMDQNTHECGLILPRANPQANRKQRQNGTPTSSPRETWSTPPVLHRR